MRASFVRPKALQPAICLWIMRPNTRKWGLGWPHRMSSEWGQLHTFAVKKLNTNFWHKILKHDLRNCLIIALQGRQRNYVSMVQGVIYVRIVWFRAPFVPTKSIQVSSQSLQGIRGISTKFGYLIGIWLDKWYLPRNLSNQIFLTWQPSLMLPLLDFTLSPRQLLQQTVVFLTASVTGGIFCLPCWSCLSWSCLSWSCLRALIGGRGEIGCWSCDFLWGGGLRPFKVLKTFF